MKVIVRPRQMGKTSDLIEYASKNDYVIVCQNHRAREHIQRLADKLGCKIRPPIYPRKLTDNSRAIKDSMKCIDAKGIVVDDIEWVLQEFLGMGMLIRGFTATGIPEVEFDEVRYHEEVEDRKRKTRG